MNKLKALLVLCTVALLTAVITGMLFLQGTQSQRIPMDVEVAGVAGFNLQTDAVHFGKLGNGQESVRSITLLNVRNYDQHVDIQFEGQIASWVSADAMQLLLKPGENRTLNLTLHVPDGTPMGMYAGTLEVIWRRSYYIPWLSS
ncbi:MAG TPA: hypothetical protein VLJ21_03185 [Candidatus Binatia bacterium]|nr:hypothetical protein [Candidatus Binatia bacterium]